jgi:signal transduction histidine kinase
MTDECRDAGGVFLSTLPAGGRERRFAVAVVLVSSLAFLAVVPFAQVQFAPVWAFIPLYQAAFVMSDGLTALVLFSQFRILRSRALLALASGYLFTAGMAVAHGLTFPGLFARSGLLGAGPQTTAWLYMFWHSGFPLCVVAYVYLKKAGHPPTPPRGGIHVAVLASVAASLVGVCGLTLLATAGQHALPVIMRGHQYTPAMLGVVASVWALSLLALAALWWRRPHTVLDLWLMVVMCAWCFDIALAAVLNQGRFDLGFYAGRIYGLLTASFVLVMLLLENSRLYVQLVEAYASERRERQLVQQRTNELLVLNQELDAFSYSVSHDLRGPLRAIGGFAHLLDETYGERLDVEGRRLLRMVLANQRHMGQLIEALLAFAHLGRQPLRTELVQLDTLVQQILTELHASGEGRWIDFTVGPLGSAEADPALLKQVLVNLLSNAIKFTRDKHPAIVEVGCQGGAAADHAKVYYVKDNGTGFDMRYAAKLFGVFQRLHRADEYEGTGVGLAIVQRIIGRHSGRVWADSTPGDGATFYFTLQPGPSQEHVAYGSRLKRLEVVTDLC